MADEAAWRQALATASKKGKRRLGPPEDVRSALGEELLLEWAEGYMSANKVQRLATLACKDIQLQGGRPNAMLEVLAGLGTCGQYPSNVRTELVRYVKKLVPTMEPSAHTIPLLITKGPRKGVQQILAGLVKPHELMRFYYTNFKQVFERCIRGPQENLARYWSSILPDDPRREFVPAMRRRNLATHGIPIALYGDAVPCCKDQSYLAISWEPLTTAEDLHSLEKIHYIGGYYSHTEVTTVEASPRTTSQAWWPPVVASLLAAEAGVAPPDDLMHAGDELAGGYFLVVMAVKGDYEFRCNYLGLPGHWSAANPCADCLCTSASGPLFFRNVRPGASWKAQTFATLGVDRWRQHLRDLGKEPAMIFLPRNLGGLGLNHNFCFHDILHCFDLGVSQGVLGNVLWHLTFTDIMGGMSPQAKFEKVAELIDEEYTSRKTPSQFTSMDISMFCDPGNPRSAFPLLRGKAANTRHLVPILKDIWARFARADIDYEQHVLVVLINLSRVYELVSAKDTEGRRYYVYPAAIHSDLVSAIDRMLLHLAYLCTTCADLSPPRLLWNFTPKVHHAWHVGAQAKWTSLRLMWTYNNEDFMGHVQCLGEAQRHGLKAAERSAKMAEAYLLSRSLRIRQARLGAL